MDISLTIITILVIWRLANLFTYEDGPWSVFAHLRGHTARYKWIDLDCFNCTSIWIALPYSFMFDNWFLYWLFLSAMAIILERVINAIEG